MAVFKLKSNFLLKIKSIGLLFIFYFSVFKKHEAMDGGYRVALWWMWRGAHLVSAHCYLLIIFWGWYCACGICSSNHLKPRNHAMRPPVDASTLLVQWNKISCMLLISSVDALRLPP